jgi:anti-sigma B factor antagonist
VTTNDDTLRIEVLSAPGATVVLLVGELDLVYADDVRDALIGADGPEVVVDLSGLEFIDSSGLSALITARRRVMAGGNRLVLRGAQGAARRVFELTGLDDVLEDVPEED